MSELLAVGVSHKTAQLALRERLALPESSAEALIADLLAEAAITEAVSISTCNRTELYLVVGDPVEAESAVLMRLARHAGIRPTELVPLITVWRNCDAARHLFRVTSGLESMIIGEAEVQGQVKRAYDSALAAHRTGPLTNRLFRAALATGKRVRSETAIGVGAASIPSVAVEAARRRLGDLREKRVLVIGAGETSELTARALSAHGVNTLFIANRHLDRAQSLAARYHGRASSFDDLPEEIAAADIVITSTASTEPILGAEELEVVLGQRDGRPLMLVDLAVPRDIDSACGLLPGVTLYDVDALQDELRRNQTGREGESHLAEGIVEEEITSFAGWLGSLEVLPTVTALRQHGNQIVRSVLEENEGRWEELSEADRARVELLAKTVMNRLLHEPTVRVKRMSADRRHGRIELIRELFGLDADDDYAEDGARTTAPAEVHALPKRRAAR